MSEPRSPRGHSGSAAEVVLALPVFNAAHELAGLVASALAQGDAVEVHLFDNASDDATVRVARELLPTEVVHESPTNVGAVGNFQRAFDETTSEFFLWLAHDDRLQPGAVAAAVEALRQHPEAAAALPTVRFTDDAGDVVSVQPPLRGLAAASPYRRLWTFVDQVYWVELYAVFRRESLQVAMPMPEGYGFDVVVTWRLLLRQPYCAAPAAVLDYRTAPAKTVQESAAAFYPPGQTFALRRPNATLWRQLWRETAQCEDRSSRLAGRLALISVTVRSSTRTRVMRRVRARLLRIRARVAPSGR